jgi:hypothetical protein
MTNIPTPKKLIPLTLIRTCANFFGDWNRDARPPLREKSRHPARVMVTETVTRNLRCGHGRRDSVTILS